MEDDNSLRLLSISKAAKLLGIGKASLYNLIDAGKIGFIDFGERRKIPVAELVRFQKEELRKIYTPPAPTSKAEINHSFYGNRYKVKTFDAKQIMSEIIAKHKAKK